MRNWGLSDEELQEAMTLYTQRARQDIYKEIGLDPDALGQDDRIIIEAMMDKAFTRGMELGGNTYALVHFWQDEKHSGAPKVRTYDFEEDKGVSGVLFPSGVFEKCGNAQHSFLMQDVSQDVQRRCLYFSSTLRGEGDGFITKSPVGFTAASTGQLVWMEEHFKYMDRGQKRIAWLDWKIGE